MSITETTASPQHKLQWLSEQALNWSGLPVVHVRPTVFLEGFFLTLTSDSGRRHLQLRPKRPDFLWIFEATWRSAPWMLW
jgi:hypothetical protein